MIISMLPDELLGLILSHLTFKQHVASSVLCGRWRYLWTSTTTKLDFDGTDTLERLIDDMFKDGGGYELAAEVEEKLKFVGWVNHVLKSRKPLMKIEPLHNCPLLEDLSVSRPFKRLSTLRVVGPLPSLKRLQISECGTIRSLQICDVHHLGYLMFTSDLHLHNLPMLLNLSLPLYVLEKHVVQFSSILEQLEILNLNVANDDTFRFPVQVSNLKELVYIIQRLVCKNLRLRYIIPISKYFEGELPRKKMEKEVYSELKEVKLLDFRGMMCDFEFVFHFVDNARSLKKIVIDPKFPDKDLFNRVLLKTDYEENDVMTALDLAEKKLAHDVPSNRQVEFLTRF